MYSIFLTGILTVFPLPSLEGSQCCPHGALRVAPPNLPAGLPRCGCSHNCDSAGCGDAQCHHPLLRLPPACGGCHVCRRDIPVWPCKHGQRGSLGLRSLWPHCPQGTDGARPSSLWGHGCSQAVGRLFVGVGAGACTRADASEGHLFFNLVRCTSPLPSVPRQAPSPWWRPFALLLLLLVELFA